MTRNEDEADDWNDDDGQAGGQCDEQPRGNGFVLCEGETKVLGQYFMKYSIGFSYIIDRHSRYS